MEEIFVIVPEGIEHEISKQWTPDERLRVIASIIKKLRARAQEERINYVADRSTFDTITIVATTSASEIEKHFRSIIFNACHEEDKACQEKESPPIQRPKRT